MWSNVGQYCAQSLHRPMTAHMTRKTAQVDTMVSNLREVGVGLGLGLGPPPAPTIHHKLPCFRRIPIRIAEACMIEIRQLVKRKARGTGLLMVFFGARQQRLDFLTFTRVLQKTSPRGIPKCGVGIRANSSAATTGVCTTGVWGGRGVCGVTF